MANFSKKISTNFSMHELVCPCCGLAKIKPEFISWLQGVRDAYGKKMGINSWVRCVKHNLEVKGKSNSAHLFGNAVDVFVDNSADRYRLIEIAVQYGAYGIGVYKSWVHLDRKKRAKRVMWYG